MNSVVSEYSDLESGVHGRETRLERNIEKIDQQRALRYGMVEKNRKKRLKYTYGGIVFIYDPIHKFEVTSWPSRDAASAFSGTRCTKPVLLDKKRDYNTEIRRLAHNQLRTSIVAQKETWKSHSVLVVDMSGSMRRDDVDGSRCRSDGVWMVLARNFVKNQLEAKTASAHDLVSVVVMQDSAEVVLRCEPIDWVLYNTLLDFREWSTLKPHGPGNYMPALDKAETLLGVNSFGNCNLALVFCSDGKPSDTGDFAGRVGKIASRFGRRLTVCCIGMAEQTEDFSTLESMSKEADSYGSIAIFNKPSLSTDSLSNIISSLVSSLTSSKTEMTDLQTGKLRVARTDVLREKKDAPDDLVLTEEWRSFDGKSFTQFVDKIWIWDSRYNDFVLLMDPHCIVCFAVVADNNFKAQRAIGECCQGCKACFVCYKCRFGAAFREHKQTECRQLAEEKRKLIYKAVPSFSVGMKTPFFSEGMERLVRRFRFLDDSDNFIGPRMVAKETRFAEEEGSYDTKMGYHRDFMRTQALASRFASKYNDAMDSLVTFFDASRHAWLEKLPRVRFLEPMVFQLFDKGDELNVLVEEFLPGLYQKFNNNMGYVQGGPSESLDLRLLSLGQDHGSRLLDNGGDTQYVAALSAIKEEESDDDTVEYSDVHEHQREEKEGHVYGEGIFDSSQQLPTGRFLSPIGDYDFPQAFSHFTYEKSRRQLLVVDLQGVLQVYPDGTREFVLTDPAIHQKKTKTLSLLHKLALGRTDRGEKGIRAFFDSHKCNDACRLLGLDPNQADKVVW